MAITEQCIDCRKVAVDGKGYIIHVDHWVDGLVGGPGEVIAEEVFVDPNISEDEPLPTLKVGTLNELGLPHLRELWSNSVPVTV